jgi:cytoskeletal protein RodZ
LHPHQNLQGKREAFSQIMPTLGEELKRRREERDISLNEISESTKIGIRFLKAIDSDNYTILPGGIFTRSFIRAYAKQVGMNEDEAMGLYNEQLSPAKPETSNLSEVAQQSELTATRKTSRLEKKQAARQALSIQQPEVKTPPLAVPRASTQVNWGTLIIGVGILIIIGIIVTALVRQLNKASAEKQANNTSVAKVEPDQPQNTTPETRQGQPPTTSPQTPPDSSTTPPPNLTQGDAIRVKLEAATGDCWLRYQVDEAPATQMILKQGLTQEVPPAQNVVKINYGNRQTLKLFINDKEAYFPADSQKFKGQVILTRDNLQTFFQPPPAQ